MGNCTLIIRGVEVFVPNEEFYNSFERYYFWCVAVFNGIHLNLQGRGEQKQNLKTYSAVSPKNKQAKTV